MAKKRKSATVLTRTESSKKFCGQPSPLDTTEPPTLCQVIQYSYFVKNGNPDLKEYDISKLIAKDVIEVWRSVNPRLPLYEYYIVKKIDKACFQKMKKINWKMLSTVQQQNLEESLDKLFDISACTCHLPIQPCNDKCVRCQIENCQTQHIVCLCPPNKKVPLEEGEYLRDQRAKHGPKGSFQLGSVDQEAVKTMRRAEAKTEIEEEEASQGSTLHEHVSCSINLSHPGICEPALTEHFSDSDLHDALENGTQLKLPDLPSHSQSVERAVKLTSEASAIVYGLEST